MPPSEHASAIGTDCVVSMATRTRTSTDSDGSPPVSNSVGTLKAGGRPRFVGTASGNSRTRTKRLGLDAAPRHKVVELGARPMSVEEVARALGTSVAKVREIEHRAVTKFVREAHRHGLIDRLPTVDELRSWEWASRAPRNRDDDDVSPESDARLAGGDTGEGLDPYRGADAVDPYQAAPSEEGGLE